MNAGLQVGAQCFILRGESVVADLAVGIARQGVEMRSDTLMMWMSACKPVAAVAIAQLWERGLLDLDDPVARYLPEFGARGKEAVTIRHILTHTGGFRALLGNWEHQPWEQIIAAVCDMRLESGWVPGRKAGYHVATSWYILGELVRRLSGLPFEQYVRENIFLPIGMKDSWIGISPETYRAYGDRIGFLHDTSAAAPKAPIYWDTEEGAARCRPAGNGRGPARELARFYQMLRNGGTLEGQRLVSVQTAEAILAPHRVGMYDHTFRHVMDWGLGFIVNSARYGVDTVPYGFGPRASDRAVGHNGHQSACALVDREYGLVVAVICNGMPNEVRHHVRMREILEAVYADAGIEA